MKAATLSPVAYSRSRARIWRIAGWSALVALLIIAGVLFWPFLMARSALPEIDGTVAVPGLSAPVRVTRDGHGVPTIDALTKNDREHDLFALVRIP